MVLIMVPGLGFLYSGLARRKSALSLIWACVGSSLVVTFQWYFWGYSLAFSSSATNGFIGNLKHFALENVLATPSPGSPLVPELLYSFYQVRLFFLFFFLLFFFLFFLSGNSVREEKRTDNVRRCNSPLLPSPLSWALLLNEGGCCRRWSSRSCGLRSFTAPSRVGCGTSTVGRSSTVSWTTQVNLT